MPKDLVLNYNLEKRNIYISTTNYKEKLNVHQFI